MNAALRALRCRIAYILDEQSVPLLVSGLSHPGLLNLNIAGRQAFSLVLTTGARRLDLQGPSLFGEGMSFIERGDELLWLHHPARLFFRLHKPDLPPVGFAQPLKLSAAPAIEPVETLEQGEAPATFRIRLGLRETDREWRHELICRKGGDPELSVRLLEMLVGDQACHRASGYPWDELARHVSQLGVPVEASLAVRQLDQEGFRTTSRTTVEGVRLEDLDETELAVPEGYQDARQLREPTDAPVSKGLVPPTPAELQFPKPSFGSLRRGRYSMTRLPREPREPPDGGDEEPRPPASPPMNTASSIALRIEQNLLDDVSRMFNTLVTPFTDFSGQNGFITIEWLKLLRDDVARRGSNAPGTFLYRLLHDVDFPDRMPNVPSSPPINPDCERSLGRGLLDRIALRDARDRFRAGAYPTAILQTLPPSMRSLIVSHGTNWDALPDGVKLRLACELVERELGILVVPFPQTLSPGEPVLGLLHIRIDDIAARLVLPPVPPPVPPSGPRLASLLTLATRADGAIVGSLNLGTMVLTGVLSRWPSLLYIFVVGATAYVAIFVPALWWVFSFLVNVGLFLALDVASLSVVGGPLSAQFTLSFRPGVTGVLEPRVDVTLTGPVSVLVLSSVPIGLHQIVDGIIGLIAGSAGSLMNGVQGMLTQKLTAAAQALLGAGFPGSQLNLGLPIIGGRTAGATTTPTTRGHVYLEAALGQSSVASQRINPGPVRANLRLEQSFDLARVLPQINGRHYASLSLSENALNQILAMRWDAEVFDRILSVADATALKILARPPVPVTSYRSVIIAPSAPPRLSLTAGLPGGQNAYATLHIEDGILSLQLGATHRFELSFRVQVPAQVVIGSALSMTPFVSLGTALDQPIDVLLDLNSLSVAVTRIRESSTTTVRTETIELDEDGKPRTVIEVSEVESVIEHPLTPQSAATHIPLVAEAFRRGYMYRSSLRAPRKDGVTSQGPPGIPAPLDQQLYTFDGNQDPDNLPNSPVLAAPVRLGTGGGLWHAHMSLLGFVEAALSGTVPIGLLTARQAEGVLAQLKDPLRELSEGE